MDNVNTMSVEDITKFLNKSFIGVPNTVEWLVTSQPLKGITFSHSNYDEKDLFYANETYNLVDYSFLTQEGTIFEATYNLGSMKDRDISANSSIPKPYHNISDKLKPINYDAPVTNTAEEEFILSLCVAYKEHITNPKLLILVENWITVNVPTDVLVTKKLNKIFRYECMSKIGLGNFNCLEEVVKYVGQGRTVAYCMCYKFLNGHYPYWLHKGVSVKYPKHLNSEDITTERFIQALNHYF